MAVSTSILIVLFLTLVEVAIFLGFSDAIGLSFGSRQRYHEPVNSLRLGKNFVSALLLVSLWQMIHRKQPERVQSLLSRSLLLTSVLRHASVDAAHRHRLAPALAASAIGSALVGCWVGLLPSEARANDAGLGQQVIRVGPQKLIKTIAQAARLARDGAIIEVDSGEYASDVAVWTQDRLTLSAVGGRVKLTAAGASAEGKAIWVVRGGQVFIGGFDFIGARVPSKNGAGIRFEKGFLQVRDCTFTDNENGILTSNQPGAELEIENSEFGHNGHGDGQSHNLYVGAIARLSVTGSYFHHAKVGHLLKSRAAVNHINHNRLTDETGGTASYELEFPSGGLAYVGSNVIAQSAQTKNPSLVSFGAEGYKWPRNEIHMVNNTLVNPLPRGGVFLWVAPGADAIRAENNRLGGPGNLESAGPGKYSNNLPVDPRDYARGLGDAAHNPQAMPRMTPPLPN